MRWMLTVFQGELEPEHYLADYASAPGGRQAKSGTGSGFAPGEVRNRLSKRFSGPSGFCR